MNKHRDIIYTRRNKILSISEDIAYLEESIKAMIHNRVKSIVLAEEAK